MKTDRQELEALRLSLCQLAKMVEVQNPLAVGSISECMERAKLTDRGWNTLVLDIMEAIENLQEKGI